jgi:hypothetical protein
MKTTDKKPCTKPLCCTSSFVSIWCGHHQGIATLQFSLTKAMNLEKLLLQITASNNSMGALGNLLSIRIALCYYHGDFETATMLASDFRRLCKQEGTVALTASQLHCSNFPLRVKL